MESAGRRNCTKDRRSRRSGLLSKSQYIVGEGAMPMREIFATLKKMNFKGGCMLEYEIDADNPAPGMIKSFGNMRKVLGQVGS